MFRGPANSVIIEKALQVLQDEARVANTNTSLCRQRRLMALIQRGVLRQHGLEDMWDESQVVVGRDQEGLPKRMFDWSGAEPVGFEDSEFQAVYEPGTRFLSTSATGLQLQCAAWALLLEAHTKNRAAEVGQAWLASVLIEGQVVLRVEEMQAWLVLQTCQWGALLWPMQRFESHGICAYQPCIVEGNKTRWFAVLHADEWLSVKTTVVPPAVNRLLLGSSSTS
jgi:hypothetical protein